MRQIFLLDLRDQNLAPDYESCHRPGRIPVEVLADIRAAGVETMEIYRAGDRLVMVTESTELADAAARVSSQASRDWERRMDRFQMPLPGGPSDEKWRPAHRIFDLSEHYLKGTNE